MYFNFYLTLLELVKSLIPPRSSFYVENKLFYLYMNYFQRFSTFLFMSKTRDKYCKDMKPSEKVVEDALDSISKGISIAEYRDNKLKKILNVFGLSGR